MFLTIIMHKQLLYVPSNLILWYCINIFIIDASLLIEIIVSLFLPYCMYIHMYMISCSNQMDLYNNSNNVDPNEVHNMTWFPFLSCALVVSWSLRASDQLLIVTWLVTCLQWVPDDIATLSQWSSKRYFYICVLQHWLW